MRPLPGLVLLCAALLASCGGGDAGRGAERPEEQAEELADVPLREGEAPEGLEPNEAAIGPVSSLREVLPPRTEVPNLPPLPGGLRDAFEVGYETAYLRRGGGAGGPRTATSTAVRFDDDASASAFLTYLGALEVGAGETGIREDVAAQGLGDEGYGWHEREPGAESTGLAWRSGDLVLTVTIGGALGTAGAEEARDLAERIDERLD